MMRQSQIMKAMVLEHLGAPLVLRELPLPVPGPRQILVKVLACGICRTDLHVADGDLPDAKLPLIPGHEIIGKVVGLGADTRLKYGDFVGIPWLAYACGNCKFCLSGNENLCDHPLFTGYTVDGGFAEYTLAYSDFCFRIPKSFANPAAAPLMCAGLVGFRSYKMIPASARRIGIYGFGAAAHILIQIAGFEGKEVFAFTREGDKQTQEFARQLGAVWAGSSDERPPDRMDAAIIFAPVGALVPVALEGVVKGGVVICGGIHMSDISSFPYRLLWEERILRSVANLTRKDGDTFLKKARKVPVKTSVTHYPLERANEAFGDLRAGRINGAAVLIC